MSKRERSKISYQDRAMAEHEKRKKRARETDEAIEARPVTDDAEGFQKWAKAMNRWDFPGVDDMVTTTGPTYEGLEGSEASLLVGSPITPQKGDIIEYEFGRDADDKPIIKRGEFISPNKLGQFQIYPVNINGIRVGRGRLVVDPKKVVSIKSKAKR